MNLQLVKQVCDIFVTICVNNYPTRCNNMQFIYICKLLYMFRVVRPHEHKIFLRRTRTCENFVDAEIFLSGF